MHSPPRQRYWRSLRWRWLWLPLRPAAECSASNRPLRRRWPKRASFRSAVESAMEKGDAASAEQLLGQAVKVCPDDIESRRHYAEATVAERPAQIAPCKTCCKPSPNRPTMPRWPCVPAKCNSTLDCWTMPKPWRIRCSTRTPMTAAPGHCGRVHRVGASSIGDSPISSARWSSTATIAELLYDTAKSIASSIGRNGRCRH